MQTFSRILVALDLSPMDAYLIEYARKVAGVFRSSQVYFVHIIPDLSLPKSEQLEFRQRFAPETPVDEQVSRQLGEKIKSHWGETGQTQWSIDVIEGKPYTQLLRWLEIKKIELLVIGQKQESLGSGITSRKLANNASCSVLFVPEKKPREGSHLLVPVDFSKDSAQALHLALGWKLKSGENARVTALHITDLIAAGYYLDRQEFENFNRFLTDTAMESFNRFLADYNLPGDQLEEQLLRNDEGSISDRIIEFAKQDNADWILVGAQGHGAIERFFFGSITEKLVSQPLPAPTLVVR
jgi:nucleotide-binding universal stress UspA family protein